MLLRPRPCADFSTDSPDTPRWIFGKKVFIPAGLVERVDCDGETVYLSRAKDEIERAPEFDEDHYTEPAYRDKIGAYYAHGGHSRGNS